MNEFNIYSNGKEVKLIFDYFANSNSLYTEPYIDIASWM